MELEPTGIDPRDVRSSPIVGDPVASLLTVCSISRFCSSLNRSHC